MTSRGAEKMISSTIGIDISKDTLDVHRMADSASRRFGNDKAGFKALLPFLGSSRTNAEMRVVFEPTGPYHRALERVLAKAGVALVKVNPRPPLRRGHWKLAKTDRLDAALLARMGPPSISKRAPPTTKI